MHTPEWRQPIPVAVGIAPGWRAPVHPAGFRQPPPPPRRQIRRFSVPCRWRLFGGTMRTAFRGFWSHCVPSVFICVKRSRKSVSSRRCNADSSPVHSDQFHQIWQAHSLGPAFCRLFPARDSVRRACTSTVADQSFPQRVSQPCTDAAYLLRGGSPDPPDSGQLP
ncbi:MAG: hypothetical protein RL026_2862 [Pseudomonadota bacterium]